MASLLPFGSAPARPAGSSGQIQFNNSAKFGADSNLFWDNTNKRLGIGTNTPAYPLVVKSPSSGDGAVLSATLYTSIAFNNATYWTSTGWTTTSTLATHTTGNTTPLIATSANFTPVASTTYLVTFQITGSITAGESITVQLGGVQSTPVIGISGTFGMIITAGTTSNLEFIPTSNWNGSLRSISSIAFNVKSLTPSTPLLEGVSSSGTDAFELRHGSGTNVLFGFNAGKNIATATQNVAIGFNALATGVTSTQNVAIGTNALGSAGAGGSNVAIGQNSLQFNNSGSDNIAIGLSALFNNTQGGNNTAVGPNALSSNISGGSNAAFATNALGLVTTGFNNIGIGNSAGVTGNSGNAVTTGGNNTFIGALSGPSTSTQLTNATAIGYQATVASNNALVLGAISGTNGASSDTFVGIRTTTPITNFHINGGMAYNRTAVADAAYSILTTDYIVALTSITAARIFTLPTAVGVTGQAYVIKDESGSVSGTNTLTIATTSSQTIDGATTAVITVPYTSLTVYSNGSNWGII